MPDPDWMFEAACRPYPLDYWFATDLRSPERAVALRICETCPVKKVCGEAALEEEQDFTFREFVGIRGGMVPDARRKVIRDRRMSAA